MKRYGVILERMRRKYKALDVEKQELAGQIGDEHQYTKWTLEIVRRLEGTKRGSQSTKCDGG
jgi:hypothetical protein